MSEDQRFILELGQLFVIGVAIVSASMTIVGAIAFYRSQADAAETFSYLFVRGNILHLLTVTAVLVCATLLGLVGKIPSEGLIAIFSGIAGYVLGGVAHRRTKDAMISPETARARLGT